MSMFDVGTFDDEPKSDNQSNFEISEILNQSIMRYNQVFATKADITIEGDFSLHAGDLVFFDAPSPRTDTKNDEVDRQSGGLYIIASLCHYISTERTLTKLSLVRDSLEELEITQEGKRTWKASKSISNVIRKSSKIQRHRHSSVVILRENLRS